MTPKKSAPPPDLGLIRAVVENLDMLAKKMPGLVTNEDVKDEATRLRFLLTYNNFASAWNSLDMGKRPEVIVPDLMAMIDNTPLSEVKLAFSSGATIGGGWASSVVFSSRARTPEEVKASYERKKNKQTISLTIDKFQKGVSVIVAGKPITRGTVIGYIANKLGVAHYDPRRDPEEALLDQSNILLTVGLLPIYNELLSYAQQLLNAADTQAFLKKARLLIGP